MDLGLADRVYVLTGASRGLGFAAAEALVADGAKVVLGAPDPDRVAAAAQRLGGAVNAIAIPTGLAGVAKDMADALGPHGIRVFGLLPHRIMTDRNRELFAATGDADRAREEAEAAIPLRRVGEPAEFGRTAAFLLSPAASYLTGL